LAQNFNFSLVLQISELEKSVILREEKVLTTEKTENRLTKAPIACLCGPSVQTVSVKKTKHLELSEKFWLYVKKYVIKFLSKNTSVKIFL
jgi:hypothetical protein